VIIDAFRLTDLVSIVTGAGAGIGREIAVAFAEAGADVVVAARTAADLDDTVRLIEQTGRRGRHRRDGRRRSQSAGIHHRRAIWATLGPGQ
jgi:NAD(P)-dependent dehydrogenase (short-subunit alcohol dehydrogenase family)